mmetsp:Transcript_24327/g.96472  ORF Transcript_24327/g.96472 Transcript_24327/m.96472 type:complete len:387 (+) Transcript_24327:62-1222(+)
MIILGVDGTQPSPWPRGEARMTGGPLTGKGRDMSTNDRPQYETLRPPTTEHESRRSRRGRRCRGSPTPRRWWWCSRLLLRGGLHRRGGRRSRRREDLAQDRLEPGPRARFHHDALHPRRLALVQDVGVGLRGEADDGERGELVEEPARRVDAVEHGHAEVHDDDVELGGRLDDVQCLLAVFGERHADVGIEAAQVEPQNEAVRLHVVGDEHRPQAGHGRVAARSGSSSLGAVASSGRSGRSAGRRPRRRRRRRRRRSRRRLSTRRRGVACAGDGRVEAHAHRGALAEHRRGDADRAAVQADEHVRDRQAETRPARRVGRLHLLELLEDRRPPVRRDAAPRVDHVDLEGHPFALLLVLGDVSFFCAGRGRRRLSGGGGHPLVVAAAP